jgi:hypothetical protein
MWGLYLFFSAVGDMWCHLHLGLREEEEEEEKKRSGSYFEF